MWRHPWLRLAVRAVYFFAAVGVVASVAAMFGLVWWMARNL